VKDRRLIAAAIFVFVIALGEQCSSKPAPVPLTPVVSVRELMENIVEPTADVIFDSVVTTSSASGVVETKPTSEDDWVKVQRAAMLLAEATNLLKMPRQIAPAGDEETPGGELSPPQIQAKVDADRAAFATFVDGLRDVAIKGLAVAKAKDVDGLYQVGSDLDKACENCHLEYWYPADKSNVLK
jgi:hypothetical protein